MTMPPCPHFRHNPKTPPKCGPSATAEPSTLPRLSCCGMPRACPGALYDALTDLSHAALIRFELRFPLRLRRIYGPETTALFPIPPTLSSLRWLKAKGPPHPWRLDPPYRFLKTVSAAKRMAGRGADRYDAGQDPHRVALIQSLKKSHKQGGFSRRIPFARPFFE